jgi:hypothetical protein
MSLVLFSSRSPLCFTHFLSKMKNKQQLCSSLTLQWGGDLDRSLENGTKETERVKRGGIINDLHYKMI